MALQIRYNSEHHVAQQLREFRTGPWRKDSAYESNGKNNSDVQFQSAYSFYEYEYTGTGDLTEIVSWVKDQIFVFCSTDRLKDFADIVIDEMVQWFILVDELCEGEIESRNAILTNPAFKLMINELAQLGVWQNREIYHQLSREEAGWQFDPQYFLKKGTTIAFSRDGFEKMLLIDGEGEQTGCPFHHMSHPMRRSTMATGFAEDFIAVVVKNWTSPHVA